jgi:2,4-dienoyl-CoA reductase-like NADH-dependent reductase (Old Yellow Enzyme family)
VRAGRPSAELAAYYRRRAEGGVGLIIGESSAIDHPSSTVQPSSAHINAGTRDAWAHCVAEGRRGGRGDAAAIVARGALRTDGRR